MIGHYAIQFEHVDCAHPGAQQQRVQRDCRRGLTTHQFLVCHPMRLIGVRAFPSAEVGIVFFKIPLGADHVVMWLWVRADETY